MVSHTAQAITGISLASFLQLLEQERKSCTLVVPQDGQEAKFFFKNGMLVEAEHAGSTGLEAAYTILSWENATFYLAPAEHRRPAISQPLAQIILTASTQLDEHNARNPQKKRMQRSSQSSLVNPTVESITTNLLAIPGVKHYHLLNRQGKLIIQSTKNQKICDFIAYCVVSGIQMREALDARGLHNIRIRLANDNILLIVPVSGAIIGLVLDQDANIADIYPLLRKALTKVVTPS